MSNIIMMCGVPGSGKTTYVKENMYDPEEDAYISRDEIRYEILGEGEDYFAHEGHVYCEFVNRIKKAVGEGRECVFVDATHLNRASRKKLVKQLGINPSEITVMWMDTPFNICLERNRQRQGRECVPDKEMYAMKNRFQVPSKTVEGFGRVIRVHDGIMEDIDGPAYIW